ncbi:MULTISPECIES: PTS sugar transporter subunit IIA [Clostridia]|uniref:PTS sugar transporter subunit IIA n=1 Tax=Clostridia TaxID=186801 RepID=UPI000EA043AB|nr:MULTISPECIES: PTS sugar transporter subunit IIA [Clostridia]NBJ67866.1 PTS sugar transporter subunit IIA [Roseburia sp. 1XD42-34]RKI82317.1 PTS sugar transporter subunit IIA [Clostridium sp. 1xD42-85]
MTTSILDMQHITFQTAAKTKDEALQFIADFAKEQGIVKSAKAYYKGLKKREEEVTTGFKNSIAIPHCKHKTVKKPGLILVKFKNPIDWESMDNQPVHITFALAIPEGKNQEHLTLLSTISRALIDEAFTKKILEASTTEEMFTVIKNKLLTQGN